MLSTKKEMHYQEFGGGGRSAAAVPGGRVKER